MVSPPLTTSEDANNTTSTTAGTEVSRNFVRPPQALVIEQDKDMSAEWKLWKQQYQLFETASRLNKEGNEIRIATFLSIIGYDALRLYNSFVQDEGENFETLLRKFDSHFVPKVNLTFERYKFHKIVQQEDEKIDSLVRRLRQQAKLCGFENLEESVLRDQLICSILSDDLRGRLLAEDISLEKAVQTCKIAETTHAQVQEMTQKMEMNAVSRSNHKKVYDCKKCGTKHAFAKCPAFEHTCEICNGKNHFEKVCEKKEKRAAKSKKSSKNKRKEVNECDHMEELTSEDDDLEISAIGGLCDKWSTKIEVLGKAVLFKIDTGAQCNVLPFDTIKDLGIPLRKSRVSSLISFSRHKLKVVGEAEIVCTLRGKGNHKIVFQIVDKEIRPILGYATSEQLELVKRINLIQNEELFDGLGCFKKFTYDIELTDNPEFEICPARRIPLKIKSQVKKEVDKMVRLGVIVPVTAPTPCVSPMVIVRQKGKIRICMDTTKINKFIKRRHYPLSTLEEIATRLSGSKYFTLLDCVKGYWQIKVSKKSQEILTFSTPWGRFSYQRMPFGISSAPEVFQQIMKGLFENVPNVEISLDDILIHSTSREGLKRTTKTVLDILQKNGLKLNKDKCVFQKKSLKFLGHIISEHGLKVDLEKVAAIQRLREPSSKKQLQRLLGKFTYLSKFIKNFSDITSPLRELLKKDVEFIWENEHSKALQELKTLICQPPVLKLYDVNKPVKLQVDASSTALGAVLMQSGRPVAYASKSLTECQKRYSQLEKECLAIKFGCEKFHEYVWGKEILIESDHKPLENIFKKPLHLSPARLQRMRVSLLTYNPTVVYKKGVEMYLADPLSRDCENSASSDDDQDLEVQMLLSISQPELHLLKSTTNEDQVCQLLKKYILEGWPKNINEIKDSVKPFWNFQEDLSVAEELIYKSHKILIPTKLRKDMLKHIHGTHFSYEKCIKRAKDFLFWPNLNNDVKEYITNCVSCAVHQRKPNELPIINKQIPTYPFEIVASDLFQFMGKDYMVVTDSYSGFIEFKKLKNTSTKIVIAVLKELFAKFGIPRVLETDNGPQYVSQEFKEFVKKWKFDHVTSSPYHPRGNGLAERAVQTVKNILRKCHYEKSDAHLAMLHFMNTERDDLGSPAQRLYQRNIRSTIPQSSSTLKHPDSEKIVERLKKSREKNSKQSVDNSPSVPKFCRGDNVMERTLKNTWQPAQIHHQIHPRSFAIVDQNGKLKRRNESNLKKTTIQFDPSLKVPIPDMSINPPSSDSPDPPPDAENTSLDHPITTSPTVITTNVSSSAPSLMEFEPLNDDKTTTPGIVRSEDEGELFSTPSEDMIPRRKSRFGRIIKTPKKLSL